MKKYILPLILIFAGCSGPTGSDDSFEPYRIGTWLMTTETSAEWVGSPAKFAARQVASSDTVYYSSPEGHAITIENPIEYSDYPGFIFRYTDSTYTSFDSFSEIELSHSIPFNIPVGNIYGWDDEFIYVQTAIEYDCDTEYGFTDEVIEFRTVTHQGDETVRLFSVVGMLETIDQVMFCD